MPSGIPAVRPRRCVSTTSRRCSRSRCSTTARERALPGHRRRARIDGHARARRSARRPPARGQTRGRLRGARDVPAERRHAVIKIVLADDQPLVRGGFRLILEAEDDSRSSARQATGRRPSRHAAVASGRRADGRPDAPRRRPRSNAPDRQNRGSSPCPDPHDVRPRRLRVRGATGGRERLHAQERHARGSGPRGPDRGRWRSAARPVDHAPRDRGLRPAFVPVRGTTAGSTSSPSGARGAPPDRHRHEQHRDRGAALLGEGTTAHVSHVLGKLGLRDRVQAVVFAYESGLVEPGQEVEEPWRASAESTTPVRRSSRSPMTLPPGVSALTGSGAVSVLRLPSRRPCRDRGSVPAASEPLPVAKAVPVRPRPSLASPASRSRGATRAPGRTPPSEHPRGGRSAGFPRSGRTPLARGGFLFSSALLARRDRDEALGIGRDVGDGCGQSGSDAPGQPAGRLGLVDHPERSPNPGFAGGLPARALGSAEELRRPVRAHDAARGVARDPDLVARRLQGGEPVPPPRW